MNWLWYTKKQGINIALWQNWTELLPWKIKKYNWVNFIPIEISFEGGWYKGKYFEFRFVILNFGFEIAIFNKVSREKFTDEIHELFPEIYRDKE